MGKASRPALEALEEKVLLSFAAPLAYNAGTQADGFVPNAAPINVVTADFNGDGKLDLAVAHKADNSVYMLLGNGDGTFKPAVQYAVGEGIEGRMFLGDFNGDGKLDLFLPGTSNQAIVLPGKGDGTFGPRIDSSSFSVPGTYPRGWAVGDFNGDGKLDVASTLPSNSADSGGYTVLLGNGDGTFKPGLVGPMILHYSRWMAVGDFDKDGKLDMAVADGQGNSTTIGTVEVTVLLGKGDGTFNVGGRYASPQVIHPDDPTATANPEDVFAADLNGDGNLDLIASDYDNTINVFLGNGDGTFQPAHSYEPGHYPRDVAVADVNGDGRPDLVVTNVGVNSGGAELAKEGIEPGSVSVMLGNGDGTFQGPTIYQPFAFPGWTAVGDFNGDGAPDLATTRVLDGHTVNVMLNQPSNTNMPPTVATDARATPGTVTGTTTVLSVVGADDGGESNLTYTWTLLPGAPASVTYSTNGANASKTTTATFTKPGVYTFQVMITDAGGLSAIDVTTVTVNSTLTSVVVSPGSATVAPGAVQPFTAVAADQFGVVLATQPAFAWSVGGGGTISASGLFTAGAVSGGPFTVTATGGGASGTAGVTVANVGTLTVYSLAGDGRVRYYDYSGGGGGQPQWDAAHDLAAGNEADFSIANRANWVSTAMFFGNGVNVMRGFLAFDTSALPRNAVITGATLGVFVTGTADSVNDGNDFVTVVQGLQASPTILNVNDFSKAGNAGDHPVEGSNRVDITGIATNAYMQWTLSPTGLTWISPGGFSQFAVREGHDVLDVWPGYANGQGDAISAYMSEQPGTSQDPYLKITYTIPSSNQPPTIATPAAAAPSPVTGTTTTLSVLGADDGGEGNLTYTWATTGTPPAPVKFSANGTNAAKNTTATFTKAGVYNFRVTVTDAGGLSATSSVGLTVKGHPGNDFLGNGLSAAVVFRRVNPGLLQWFVNGDTSLTGTGRPFGAGGLDVPLTGDFDGDLKADLALYRPSTGQWFVQASGSNYASTLLATFGAANTDVPMPGDYNGTGTTVPAVFRPSTGQWFLYGGVGGRNVTLPVTFPVGSSPVPGDYDNVGKTEAAVYNSKTSQWLVETPGASTTHVVATFGSASDIPAPGAYDALATGNPALEAAVWRPSTGQFFIHGPTGNRVIQLAVGDIPAPADYDGVGETEAAVYRPSTGQWLVVGPKDATPRVFAAYGGPADVPTISPYPYRALRGGGVSK